MHAQQALLSLFLAGKPVLFYINLSGLDFTMYVIENDLIWKQWKYNSQRYACGFSKYIPHNPQAPHL